MALKIFYTDDDEDDQILFQEVLKNIDDNHKLQIQSHGEELMSTLKQTPVSKPDVIFLDLNMPHKNGFEVLKEMKEDENLNDLPVVIFSTSNQEEAIIRCKELGADGYICKPTSYIDMKKMITTVLDIDWKNNNRNAFFILNQ